VKWLGYKQLAVKAIRVDMNDVKRRTKAPHVQALAKDEDDSGKEYIHAPTVRADDKLLICGRDRFAGALLNKRKKLWFHVVDCTDKEAAELEEKENIYRRHSEGERAQAILRLVALQEQKIRSNDALSNGDNVPGSSGASKSPNKVKAEARKAVARAAGITPGAVKKAEQRAAASAAPAVTEEAAGGPIELPDGFKTFDLEVSLASRSVIDETAKWLGDWDQSLKNILRELTEMEKRGDYAVAGAHLQRIREQVQNAGHAVRDAIPASLCFYCKAQPASTPNCPACGGTGVVGRHGGDNVPPELKLGGDKARVAVDGKFVPVGGAANAVEATKAKPATGKRGVRVVAVDETGAETDVPLPGGDDGEELAF